MIALLYCSFRVQALTNRINEVEDKWILKFFGFFGMFSGSAGLMVFLSNIFGFKDRVGEHLFFQFVFTTFGLVLPLTAIWQKRNLKEFVIEECSRAMRAINKSNNDLITVIV